MSKHNSLSDTKIMPAITPQDPKPAETSPRTGDTKLFSVASERQIQPQQRSSQSARTSSAPQRQRLQPPPASPPPHAMIRRASYQEKLPEQDKSMPYRRSPQSVRGREFDDEPPIRQEPPRKKKKKRRKHRKSCAGRIIKTVVITAVVLFLLYSGISVLAIRKIQHEETGQRALTAGLAEQDAAVRNILLIGTDSRDGERGRADTMIVLSFSKHNQTVTMTSLLRDSYVSIPNHGTDKLNAAYAYGGPTLLMDTIVNNYGISIDEYICVNFKAFVHIADALGGVKVTVSDREAAEINVILESEVNRIMGDEPTDDFLPSGGTFVLNGKQALSYARIRHVGNSDYERTERQRTVLDIMLNKMKHLSPTAVPGILHNALPELSTNIEPTDMYLLSLQLPFDLIVYDMQKLRLPQDGTFTDATSPDGQMVLAVDFDRNHQIYLDAVTNPVQPAPESEVQP